MNRIEEDPMPAGLVRKLRATLVRFSGLFRKFPQDSELDRELQSHLQMLIDDNVRAGMTAGEARRQALLRFGGIEAVKETYRDRRSIPMLETVWQDVRYAGRTLPRHAAASMVGIVIMALGIGANTAVFSVVYAVLIHPLPYRNAERIVTLTYVSTGGVATGDRSRQVSAPDFRDWRKEATSFESMAYFAGGRGSVMATSVAEYAVVMRVSEDFFHVFAVEPLLGRAFTNEESRSGGAALISERYARQQFGDDAHAIGQTLRFGNNAVPVVGVLAGSFDFPADTDIWLPLLDAGNQRRRGNNFRAIARLRAGVTIEQAQAEMTAISVRLEELYPDTNRGIRALVTPVQREMVGDVRAMLYLLLGAVALVLLIACVTMATLLLAKATTRAPEIAVREALGASRTRIVQQLLVEASVQAFVAGALGVLFAVAGTRALVAISPPDVPRLNEISVNAAVLFFTVAVCGVVGLLFGLPPALQAARTTVNEPLRRNSARITDGPGRRMRDALVIGELAIAVVLVAMGTLLVRSLVALQHAPIGFEPENVLVMETTRPPRTEDWSDSRAFFQALLADISRTPGVLAAGAMMGPPGRVGSESGFWIDQMPKESPLTSARAAVINVISPGAFGALGIAMQQGRDFRDGDTMAAPKVVIVNDALARAAFPGRDTLGRVIVAGFDSADPMTIVGVVGNVRQYGPSQPSQPEIYLPYQQHFYNGATLRVLVKTATDAAAFAPSIQRMAHDRSPEASVRVTTMDGLISQNIATPKFRAWLLSLFAVVAACLAMAGVYGVMAYAVGQRSKEIGIRMALGANAGSVLRMMLARGLKLTAIGLGLGAVGALVATRFVAGMLFEVQPHDLTTYVGVIAGLFFLSLAATYVPARRATTIDPLLVLRQE